MKEKFHTQKKSGAIKAITCRVCESIILSRIEHFPFQIGLTGENLLLAINTKKEINFPLISYLISVSCSLLTEQTLTTVAGT